VIRATIGMWVNYATTGAFQVAFALRYGSGMEANVFVIAFGIAIAIGGVFTSSVQSVIVPRLLSRTGQLVRSAVRLALVFTLLAAAVLLAVWFEAHAVAHVLAERTRISDDALYRALHGACPFVLLQVIAGGLIAINVAIGRRFAPAVAPALPSIAATVPLAFADHVSVSALFTALSIGALAEVAMLVVALCVGLRERWRPVAGRLPRVGLIALATTAQLVLLSLLPAFERVMASWQSPEGAAHYNYAIRSLAVVQQLLIGGWVMSSLGDWSNFARRREKRAFERSLVSTATTAGVLLTLAASIGLVAARYLVQVVYEHGAFTSSDTTSVASLVLLALPGFLAEGIGLILSQGLLAYQRNEIAIAIGLGYFFLRGGLVFAFGVQWGAIGVVAAYSVSTVVITCIEAGVLIAIAVVRRSDLAQLRRGASVAAGTLLAATACVAFARTVPSAVQASLVLATFTLLVFAARFVTPGGIGHAQ
jgi:putative peptidoglycan lipid II flippase